MIVRLDAFITTEENRASYESPPVEDISDPVIISLVSLIKMIV